MADIDADAVAVLHLWIALASDPSQGVKLRWSGGDGQAQADVDQRRYSDGTVRTHAIPGLPREVTYTFDLVPRVEAQRLERYWTQNTLLHLRDTKGVAHYGMLTDVRYAHLPNPPAGQPHRGLRNLSIRFMVSSYALPDAAPSGA